MHTDSNKNVYALIFLKSNVYVAMYHECVYSYVLDIRALNRCMDFKTKRYEI